MVPLDVRDTTPVYHPSHPIPVAVKAPIIVVVALGTMAVLLLVAVVVIIASVVVEILGSLMPIYLDLPASVRIILILRKNLLKSQIITLFLVPDNPQRNSRDNSNPNNASNASIGLWLNRLSLGQGTLPSLESLAPFVDFRSIPSDSPLNRNSENVIRDCIIDLEHLSLQSYQHPRGFKVERTFHEQPQACKY